MRLRAGWVAIVVCALLVGALVAGVGTAGAQDEDYVEPCADEHGGDFAPPENDTVGWVPLSANGTATLDGANASANGTNATTGADGTETNGTAAVADDPDGPNRTGAATEPTAADGVDDSNGTAVGNETDDGNGTDAGNGTAAGNETGLDGTWYDEPVEVDDSDGLDRAELNASVARTAARVEALRCLSFERVPSVRVINRTELESVQTRALYARSHEARLFDDARLETALLLLDERNATEARVATRTAAILAYYDPTAEEIVLVAENESDPRIDEATLAHELVHALQDQHHDLGQFDARRVDGSLAQTGLIEGDAALVETRFERRCNDGAWVGGCLVADAPASDAPGAVGLQLLLYHPYNDGPLFVQRAYSDGGWPAVDEMYDRPPTTTRHVLEPQTYPEFDRHPVRVGRNVTDDGWERLRPPEGPPFDVIGPAGIGSALIAPTFEPETEDVYPPEAVQHTQRGNRLDVLGPYRYRVDVVRNWEGGQLQVFVDDANRTATIWRTVWRSEADADAFRERYVDLVRVRGGEGTSEYEDTYRFPEHADRDGVVYVATEGEEVVVVRGPDVEALRGVYGEAAPDDPGGYASSEESSAPSSPRSNDTDGSTEEPEDAQPGLGVAAALLALLIVAALGRRSIRP